MIGIIAKTTFDVSEETNWGKKFSSENFVSVIFLSDFDWIFLHSWKESLAGISERCFYVFDVLLKTFSETVNHQRFIRIEQKHFRFLAVNNRQCCQKIKLHVQKKKEEKTLLGKLTTLSKKTLNFLAKDDQQSWQNCSRFVQRTELR